jgi:hypothetical protein
MNLFRLSDAERQLVLAAFKKANADRKSTADCYLAAIEALRERYPGVPRDLVANEAVRVLTSDIKLVDVARRRSQDSGERPVPRDRPG